MKSATLRRAGHIALAALLSVTMVLTSLNLQYATGTAPKAAASTFSDVNGHWAEEYITRAVNYGFVNGYTNGKFLPDGSITRAEFTKMLNSALGNRNESTIYFWDVPENEWFYNDVAKGVSAGYINGYSETEFAPANKITRQEAAVMLSRIVPAAGITTTLKGYGDYAAVADWATVSLQKMVGKGYIGGYNDGNLHPSDTLTRAQAAKIIDDILDNENIVDRNQTVVLSGVSLMDTIYTNQLTIGNDVADGSVKLTNCTILGELAVEGGGAEIATGVTLTNSRIAHTTVNKADAPVRLYVRGESTVLGADAYLDATLETASLSGSGDFGKGFKNVTIHRGANVNLIGDFTNVDINGTKTDVTASNGTIQTMTLYSGSTNANVKLDSTATINTLNVSAEGATFMGDGKIVRMNANANGITYENVPTKVVTGSNVAVAPSQINSAESALTITPTPADGATEVSTGESIKLTFSGKVRNSDNKDTSAKLTDSEAEVLIQLRKDSKTGTAVPFAATVSGDGTSVTLKPESNLVSGATYFIVVAEGDLIDVFGNKNKAFSSKFTTGASALDITFSPADGSSSVALSTIPTITFKEPVIRADSSSSSVTANYLSGTALKIQKQGSNDLSKTNVSFAASIDSSNKIVSILPTSSLEEETTYYVTINSGALLYASTKTPVPQTTCTFTTISDSLSNRSVEATSSTTVKLSFTPLMNGKVYAIIFPQSELKSTNPTSFSIKNHNYVTSVTSDPGHYGVVNVRTGISNSIEFSELEPNTKYFVYEVLYDADDKAYSVFSHNVTTATEKAVLKQLRIGTIVGANETEPTYENISVSSTSGTNYYIGTQSETTLYVYCMADSDYNPTYTVKCSGGETSPITINSGEGYAASVVIPAGVTTAGNLQITVDSTNENYDSTTYTVGIKRINPGITSLGINDSDSGVELYSNDITTSSVVPDTVAINGGDAVAFVNVKLEEGSYPSAVKYTLYKYVGGNWSQVTTGAGNGQNMTIDVTNLDNAAGIYKIVTKTTVNSTSTTSGTASESVTRYFSVKFTN